jgi:hypothetical protein
MVDIPNSDSQSSFALLNFRPDQLFVFISLIQSLNFAGLFEYFAVISSTFYSLLKVNVPVTICTAQLQA